MPKSFKNYEVSFIFLSLIARYQAAVCNFMGKIYVIGGTDAWICLNSVEIYDPESKKWQLGPQLNIARRGAGCDVFNGEIAVLCSVNLCTVYSLCIEVAYMELSAILE
jgi:hypothetical protein